MIKENFFTCPICGGLLFGVDKSFKCEMCHSYDVAKSGYINLLRPGKMNNAKAGDSKEMISARTLFFSTGAYEPIRKKICDLVCDFAPKTIIDAGCGEGYYTLGLAERSSDAHVIGFDMSKFGCEHGAKESKKCGISNTSFVVSSIFEMPLEGECADVIVNMFAPVAHNEFRRVLCNGGHFIVVAAGVHHLEGLKRAIYDNVYLNDADAPEYDGFELCQRENLKYDITLTSGESIWALFQMTPYYHRTSIANKEKLLSLDRIETTVEVDFFVYRKI